MKRPSLACYFEDEAEKRNFLMACSFVGKSGSKVLADLAREFTSVNLREISKRLEADDGLVAATSPPDTF